MHYPITFHFRGKQHTAITHLSLEEDGCYISTFLENQNLISEFGLDVYFEIDCAKVLIDRGDKVFTLNLKTAILEAV